MSAPDTLRARFRQLCTERQKTCVHGWKDRVERCIHCVMQEGACVLAVNELLVKGVTDTGVDAYLELTSDGASVSSDAPKML